MSHTNSRYRSEEIALCRTLWLSVTLYDFEWVSVTLWWPLWPYWTLIDWPGHLHFWCSLVCLHFWGCPHFLALHTASMQISSPCMISKLPNVCFEKEKCTSGQTDKLMSLVPVKNEKDIITRTLILLHVCFISCQIQIFYDHINCIHII